MPRLKGPNGVTVSVSKEVAERLGSEWVSESAGASHEKSATPDASWTVKDLKAHAESNSIDLDGASKKPEILAAIAAFVPPADADGSDDDESGDDDESESDGDDSDDE